MPNDKADRLIILILKGDLTKDSQPLVSAQLETIATSYALSYRPLSREKELLFAFFPGSLSSTDWLRFAEDIKRLARTHHLTFVELRDEKQAPSAARGNANASPCAAGNLRSITAPSDGADDFR